MSAALGISNILLVCDEKWDQMWMSKHHYANELAKIGYQVLFINPPTRWNPWNTIKGLTLTPVDGIEVVTLPNRIPILGNPRLAKINDWFNLRSLKRKGILRDSSLVWNFDGRRFANPGCKMIYHVVDSHKNVLLDQQVARASNLIVCVSELFYEHYSQICSPKTHIPHGISSDEFEIDHGYVDTLTKKFGSYLLCVGSFSKKTNLDLLKTVALTYPSHSLLLLGQVHFKNNASWNALLEKDNVEFLGAIAAKNLKHYVAAASVCLTAYHFNHAQNINAGAGSALKHINYLAQCKVIVSSLPNDLTAFQDKIIFSATTSHKYIELIRKALSGEFHIDKSFIRSELNKLLYTGFIDKALKLVYKEVKESPTVKGQDILVISNEPWGEVWYSKHNYANELSKNNRVIFVNPMKRWNPKSILSSNIKRTRVTDQLSVLDYGNPLPVRTVLLNKLNNRWVSFRLKRWLSKRGINKFFIWTFDPFRLYNYKQLGAKSSVFHSVDLYGFNYFGEDELCKDSNAIIVSSSLFLETYQKYETPKLFLPHGISEEEFNIDIDAAKPYDQPETGGIYIGVIDQRVDFELLEKIVTEFPDIPFLFVGPMVLPDTAAANRIFQRKLYSNVKSIGPKHFKQLKYYIKNATFCISPMDISDERSMIAHHKTLLYLAQGKPVFSPVFSEYLKETDLMYMDNTHEGIIKKLHEFQNKKENPELISRRIAYARKFTYNQLLEKANAFLTSNNII